MAGNRRILWISPIRFGETIHQVGEIGTAGALRNRGWEIDFLHADSNSDGKLLPSLGFGSFEAKKSRFPLIGDLSFTISIIRRLNRILDNASYDVIMAEWACSVGVAHVLKRRRRFGKSTPPWLFEDRSPPAHRTMIGKLHWLHYDIAWRKAAKNADLVQVLVPGLERFLRERFKDLPEMIHCPSGVDLDRFQPKEADLGRQVRIVYHGTLEEGRGLRRIVDLGIRMEGEGMDFRILVFGVGKLAPYFEEMASRTSWLEFAGEVPYEEVPELLSNNDFGILPLPNRLVWNVGSPLKVMEFASSGLCTLTTDVDGTIPFSGQDWIDIAPSNDPVDSWLEYLKKSLDNRNAFPSRRTSARRFAEQNMTWDAAVADLDVELTRLCDLRSP
ncbi:MAG: glycosyltransferase [Nitrospinaceae bacterium]|nr:glycosyltransferase [Nitrospinaceae bacterium]